MPLVQSLPMTQFLPSAQAGQEPPQSVSVSLPSLTVFVQVTGEHRCFAASQRLLLQSLATAQVFPSAQALQ